MKLKNFTGTSDAPYDKYDYVIVAKNGQRLQFDDYLQMQKVWIMSNDEDTLSHVEIVDRIEKKNQSRDLEDNTEYGQSCICCWVWNGRCTG